MWEKVVKLQVDAQAKDRYRAGVGETSCWCRNQDTLVWKAVGSQGRFLHGLKF